MFVGPKPSTLQIPSNVVFIYLGGPLMLGAIAIAWGLVAASMAAVSNTSSFLAVRFMLGIAEAGTVPGKLEYQLEEVIGVVCSVIHYSRCNLTWF